MFQYEKVLDQEPLISSDGENDGSSPRRPKRRSIAARAATVSGIALPWVLLIIMACWILLKDAQRGPERVCYPQMTYSMLSAQIPNFQCANDFQAPRKRPSSTKRASSVSVSATTSQSSRGHRHPILIEHGMRCTKVRLPSAVLLTTGRADAVTLVGFFSLLSQSEAAQLPNKTILMPHDHERRYVVGLDVFHQLHCLVRFLSSSGFFPPPASHQPI